MVIDIKKLKSSGKSECSFHFECELDNDLITLPSAEFSGPVSVTGNLTLSGKTVIVDGEIEYKLSAHCSRCLSETEYRAVVGFDEEFSENKDDIEAYIYSKGLVDLTEMVREKVILSMPYSVYCKEDCKGLCPVCGINLNEAQCDCNK